VAREAGDARLVAMSLHGVAQVLLQGGAWVDAQVEALRSMEANHAVGNVRMEAGDACIAAEALRRMDRFDEALPLLASATALYVRIGDVAGQLVALTERAQCRHKLGEDVADDLREAERLLATVGATSGPYLVRVEALRAAVASGPASAP
jgi:hypothetical protein